MDTAESAAPPQLRGVLKHLAVSVVVANVIPSALFLGCMVLGNIWVALGAALFWCYGALTWRLATGRGASGLLLLTIVGLTGKTILAFASGSTFIYFLQPALTDAAVALLFLGSVLVGRPVVAKLANDFYPMSAELAARARVQRLFRQISLVWALVIGTKAAISLYLLNSLTITDYAAARSLLNPTLASIGGGITILLALGTARAEGLLHAPAILTPAPGSVPAPALLAA